MYDVAQSKSVSRADLESEDAQSDTDSVDHDALERLQKSLAAHYDRSILKVVHDHDTEERATKRIKHSHAEPGTEHIEKDESHVLPNDNADESQDGGEISSKDKHDTDGFAFRLFAPSRSNMTITHGPYATETRDSIALGPAVTQIIRIRSPTPDAPVPRIHLPRSDSYYFTAATAKEIQHRLAAEYDASAITGHDVRSLAAKAARRWPGLVRGWKVLHIPASAERARVSIKRSRSGKSGTSMIESANAISARGTKAEVDGLIHGSRRKRMGKKGRIKRRIAHKALESKREQAQKEKEELERTQRAARAKRNRDKKFKKRARDKLKVAASAGGDSAVASALATDDAQASSDQDSS